MSDPQVLAAERGLERAVFVQACDSGWDPQTLVRQVVWQDGAVHEEQLVFPSLREALDYARGAFASTDGPVLEVTASNELQLKAS